jgi:hypothetical protein
MNNKFKDFYFKSKSEKTFDTIFEKWYSRGYWGNVEKEKIKEQQHDWYTKLKKIIEERDYSGILLVIENRENKVTRDMFTKLTKISIKKKKTEIIREKVRKFCEEGLN